MNFFIFIFFKTKTILKKKLSCLFNSADMQKNTYAEIPMLLWKESHLFQIIIISGTFRIMQISILEIVTKIRK